MQADGRADADFHIRRGCPHARYHLLLDDGYHGLKLIRVQQVDELVVDHVHYPREHAYACQAPHGALDPVGGEALELGVQGRAVGAAVAHHASDQPGDVQPVVPDLWSRRGRPEVALKPLLVVSLVVRSGGLRRRVSAPGLGSQVLGSEPELLRQPRLAYLLRLGVQLHLPEGAHPHVPQLLGLLQGDVHSLRPAGGVELLGGHAARKQFVTRTAFYLCAQCLSVHTHCSAYLFTVVTRCRGLVRADDRVGPARMRCP